MKLTLEELARAHELWTSLRTFGSPDTCGTCFHVTLEDGNYADSFAQWECERVDPSHDKCVELAPLILRMSPTQRAKLANGGYAALTEQLHAVRHA